MEYLGIPREIDEMGRIVIPKEIRRSLNIKNKDSYEILVNENQEIILRRNKNKCIFCGADENLTEFSGRSICSGCVEKISKL